MPRLTMLVGPPGSGKSTYARNVVADANRIVDEAEKEFVKFMSNESTVYVNQDSQGKDHLEMFESALNNSQNILVDRMNFNKPQRSRYLDAAKTKGYETEIIVLHQPYKVCLDRIRARFGQHETIHDEKAARGALQTFFGKYERPETGEADKITFVYPEGEKPSAVVCDLDGTLCNIEHRRHYVRRTDGQKKDWAGFYRDIPMDEINKWCAEILHTLKATHSIVLCSGRDSNQQRATVDWLKKHEIQYDDLFMRDRSDSRQDYVVKEIILDFEILTRYTPYFMIDDRQQVVDLWRRRGFVCLQCDVGDF